MEHGGISARGKWVICRQENRSSNGLSYLIRGNPGHSYPAFPMQSKIDRRCLGILGSFGPPGSEYIVENPILQILWSDASLCGSVAFVALCWVYGILKLSWGWYNQPTNYARAVCVVRWKFNGGRIGLRGSVENGSFQSQTVMI